MAKRGAALLDIKTTEELVKFLEAECLIVLNVYSGYYGPCNALAPNLRDYKMLKGGDDLQVATVNVDDIDLLKRFRKKGEPAYLMILNGQIINSFYGCDLVALLDIINEEIVSLKSGEIVNRPKSDLNAMSPLEAHRFRIMREDLIQKRKSDQKTKQQLVYDYRMFLTDNIMDNTADVGVTVFMPHVLDNVNELLSNLTEAAAETSMVLKQHVMAQITTDDLEMINFDAENLHPMVYSHIRGHDVLIVAWKMGTGELTPINEIFDGFARGLTEELSFEQKKVKKGAKGKKGKKKEEPVIVPVEGEEAEKPPFKLPATTVPLDTINVVRFDPVQIEPIDLKFIENEKDVIGLISESIIGFTNQRIVDMHNECLKAELDTLIADMDKEKDDEDENAEAKPGKKKGDTEQPEKKKKKKAKAKKSGGPVGNISFNPKQQGIAFIGPIWTPPTPRAHAAMLYVYFRKLLSFFLPMDPPGADRFVIVVFSITKHEEVLEYMKDNPKLQRDGILAHGFFRGFISGEHFKNTVLLCKTGIEYRLLPEQEPNDKLILKVVAQSEALLGLVSLEPEFVSQNEHDGRIECDVIFPLGYTSISEEEMEEEMKFDETFEAEEGAEEKLEWELPEFAPEPDSTPETKPGPESEPVPESDAVEEDKVITEE